MRWPRPIAHFTATSGWVNDPNGLIHHGGVYHLYFQHNPHRPIWGDICWGHAISRDLVHWDELPIAMRPDDLGLIFSGSVVLDSDNTAGFGPDAMVAVFTHDLDGLQRQSLAVSTDGGRTFEKFDGNPVLAGDVVDFRDPKVVRFTDGDDAWWVMALAVGTEIWFYRSDDLREWTPTSTTKPESPWPDALIEVPDLFKIDDVGIERWVLIYSLDPAQTASSVPRHVRWQIGSFDGAAFSPTSTGVLDNGAHFYAAMVWATGPDAPIAIGWMNEAEVANRDPATPWCGRHSMPRRLSVTGAGADLALALEPLGLDALGRSSQTVYSISTETTVTAACFSIRVLGRATTMQIRLSCQLGDVVIDVVDGASLRLTTNGELSEIIDEAVTTDELLAVVDAGSIEVFTGDRRRSITSLTGTGIGATLIEVSAADAGACAIEIVEYVQTSAPCE